MNYNSDFKYDLELGKIGEETLGNLLSDKKIEAKTDFQLAEFARKVKGGDNNTSNLVLIPFQKLFER
jgi:hypothetical protein